MTKEEKKQAAWSIEDLIALTDEVQNGTVDYRGKDFNFQFCELVEEEEPKIGALPEGSDESDKMAFYSKIGNQRIVAMIEKANKKQPAKANIMLENWGMLPTSLRYKISNYIMGVESSDGENFTI
jgi:hypothetical protein|tara:strand:- start:1298 stop:1672 length:375 start_codon:yes stop_codon:yes gene_type:complete